MAERLIKIDKQGQCPFDGKMTITSRFDTAFRNPDGDEKLTFGVPGNLCTDCENFFIDPDLSDFVGNDENSKCIFAIENDLAYLIRKGNEKFPSS